MSKPHSETWWAIVIGVGVKGGKPYFAIRSRDDGGTSPELWTRKKDAASVLRSWGAEGNRQHGRRVVKVTLQEIK